MATLKTSTCCIISILIELTAAVIGIILVILQVLHMSDEVALIAGIFLLIVGSITLITHFWVTFAISCKKHFREQQVENNSQTFHYAASDHRDRRTLRNSEQHSHPDFNQPPPAYQYSNTGFQHESMLFILLNIAGESKYLKTLVLVYYC